MMPNLFFMELAKIPSNYDSRQVYNSTVHGVIKHESILCYPENFLCFSNLVLAHLSKTMTSHNFGVITHTLGRPR
jgi:hypothetical protein